MLDGGNADDVVAFESILDELSTVVPSLTLNWHYRSRSEDLIAFSNAKFYDGRLITFPAAGADDDAGVVVHTVVDAVYGRGGSRANPVEAAAAAKTLAAELKRHPDREVAITAMSVAQQDEINAQVEQLARSDPEVETWARAGGRAKNLETIQGDECDTMILSLGYGRDASGKLVLNFGPLGRDGGERRLNVAVTRARWKTVVVTSIGSFDIPARQEMAVGALRLRDYLAYAEAGPVVLAADVRINADAESESPFETAVLRRLRDAGLICQPQVGVGAFRIDIGIVDPDRSGHFLLGIECDGASYHNTKSARDRDLLRQQVLENMGWRIHRVWSTCWWRNPDAEVEAIVRACDLATGGAGGRDNGTSAATSDPAIVDPPFLRQIGLPAGVVEFDDRPPFRRHVQLLARSPGQIDGDLERIVAERGPVHREEALKLLARVHGQSLGSRIRAAAVASLQRLQWQHKVEIRGEFVWPAELTPEEVLVRRTAPEDNRPVGYISVEEAARALVLACRNAESIALPEVPHTVVAFLGFMRAGADLQHLAQQALVYAEAAGWIEVSDESVRAAPLP